jgi:predicted DNA-binding transcriptional regulator AlpA
LDDITPKRKQRLINPIMPETGFVRLLTVLFFYPVSRAEWYIGMKEGRYPKPVPLGKKMVAWRVEDIRALIEKSSQSEYRPTTPNPRGRKKKNGGAQ